MKPLDRSQVFPRRRKVGSEPFEFFEVQGGEDFESLGPLRSEL